MYIGCITRTPFHAPMRGCLAARCWFLHNFARQPQPPPSPWHRRDIIASTSSARGYAYNHTTPRRPRHFLPISYSIHPNIIFALFFFIFFPGFFPIVRAMPRNPFLFKFVQIPFFSKSTAYIPGGLRNKHCTSTLTCTSTD